MKFKILKLKNPVDGLNRRIKMKKDIVKKKKKEKKKKDIVSELEDRATEFTQTEQQRENSLPKDEQSQRLVRQ